MLGATLLEIVTAASRIPAAASSLEGKANARRPAAASRSRNVTNEPPRSSRDAERTARKSGERPSESTSDEIQQSSSGLDSQRHIALGSLFHSVRGATRSVVSCSIAREKAARIRSVPVGSEPAPDTCTTIEALRSMVETTVGEDPIKTSQGIVANTLSPWPDPGLTRNEYGALHLGYSVGCARSSISSMKVAESKRICTELTSMAGKLISSDWNPRASKGCPKHLESRRRRGESAPIWI